MHIVILLVQPIWGVHAYGQHTIFNHYLESVSVSAKKVKDIVCIQ